MAAAAVDGAPPGGSGLRVFLLAAQADGAWAQWMAQQLRRAGHTVLSAPAGFSVPAGLSVPAGFSSPAGLASADRVLAVFSPSSLDSAQPDFAQHAAALRTAGTHPGGLLAVLVAPTTLPPALRRLPHLSLVGLTAEEARDRLLSALDGMAPPSFDEDVPWPGSPTGPPSDPLAGPPEGRPTPGKSVTRLPPGATVRQPRTVAGTPAASSFPGRADALAERVAAALPGYDVGARLGAGSFGVVLAARHRGLNRDVAVKVLAAAQQDTHARFAAEAQVLAGLDHHPHVVRVFDYVEHDDLNMIVMELLTGGTVGRRRADITPQDACAVGLAGAEALSYVHERGVLHRDVKPDNMLLAADGQLKVTDFGIAKIFDGAAATASAVMGTPRYMSPEQFRGDRLGPASDIYALGAVLYELLSGRPVFDAHLPLTALYHHHLHVAPTPPPGVPPAVAAVVLRALAKDPTRRYASAHAFALDLAQAAAGSYGWDWLSRTTVRPHLSDDVRAAAMPPAPVPESPRRRRRRVLVGALVALTLASAAAIVALSNRSGDPPAVAGGCRQVTILTGQPDTPYYRYGTTLKTLIEARFPGTSASVQSTVGSAYNLDSLRDGSAARCTLSVVQLTTAVDARQGVFQFDGSAVPDLRSVGPIWYDLLQLVVRRDSGITDVSGLCGAQVATGQLQSGTEQVGVVLFRQILTQIPGCVLNPVYRELPDGLADLRASRVKALLWAGGAPTSELAAANAGDLPIGLLSLGRFRPGMQEEWDRRYGSPAATGPVYASEAVGPRDYPGVTPVDTVAVPNGVVVNRTVDPVLVGFVTAALFTGRADFQAALEGKASSGDAGNGRRFPSAEETVGRSPLYCLLPLQDEAASYYSSLGVRPPCAAASPR